MPLALNRNVAFRSDVPRDRGFYREQSLESRDSCSIEQSKLPDYTSADSSVQWTLKTCDCDGLQMYMEPVDICSFRIDSCEYPYTFLSHMKSDKVSLSCCKKDSSHSSCATLAMLNCCETILDTEAWLANTTTSKAAQRVQRALEHLLRCEPFMSSSMLHTSGLLLACAKPMSSTALGTRDDVTTCQHASGTLTSWAHTTSVRASSGRVVRRHPRRRRPCSGST